MISTVDPSQVAGTRLWRTPWTWLMMGPDQSENSTDDTHQRGTRVPSIHPELIAQETEPEPSHVPQQHREVSEVPQARPPPEHTSDSGTPRQTANPVKAGDAKLPSLPRAHRTHAMAVEPPMSAKAMQQT